MPDTCQASHKSATTGACAMNLHPGSTVVTPTLRGEGAADTRLTGHWLMFARIGWIVLFILAIGLFIASVPPRYTELQRPCSASVAECGNQLVPTAAELAQMER